MKLEKMARSAALVAGSLLGSACTGLYSTNVSNPERPALTSRDMPYEQNMFTSEGKGYFTLEGRSDAKIGDRTFPQRPIIVPLKGSYDIIDPNSKRVMTEGDTYFVVPIDVKDGKVILAPEGSNQAERFTLADYLSKRTDVPEKGFTFLKRNNFLDDNIFPRIRVGDEDFYAVRTDSTVEGNNSLPFYLVNTSQGLIVRKEDGTIVLDGFTYMPVLGEKTTILPPASQVTQDNTPVAPEMPKAEKIEERK